MSERNRHRPGSPPARRGPLAPMAAPIRSARLLAVFLVLVLLGALTVYRLVTIQLVQHRAYEQRADNQYRDTRELEPERGMIYDRRGCALVENLTSYRSVGIHPDEIVDARGTAELLAEALSVPAEEIARACEKQSDFVYLAREVEPGTGERVQRLNLPGVEVLKDTKRSYPYGPIGGQVVGHVTVDNEGGAGIERVRDHILAGTPGWGVWQKDARGRMQFDPSYPRREPVDGGPVTLAIDIDAQAIAQEELAAAVARNQAACGMVVVTRPLTGEILAIASCPEYDPNRPADAGFAAQKNRALTDVFEPGSTFKIVPFAAVLERKLAALDEQIDCEQGAWRVADRVIRDSHSHDSLSVREGFAVSSNILTGKLASLMTPSQFYTVIRDFGFGEETGLDFIGEVGGLLPEPDEWSGVTQANLAMGQGIAVTALQLAIAYGAIANGGWLLRPLLILSERAPGGTVTRYTPQRIRRVLMPSTARVLRKLMVEVVEHGTGGRAQIPGVTVAGKTGTAEKPDPVNGGYMDGRYVSSFAGFLPAHRPEWLVVVVIDDPRGGTYYGGSVAAPVVRAIMHRLLVTLPRTELATPAETGRDPRALPGNHVMLPSLLASTHGEALAALAGLELEANVIGDGPVVVAQSARPGELVNAGETITLTLGGRSTTGDVVVPDVRRLALRDALAELTRRGLQPRVRGSGTVVEQTPPPGEPAAAGQVCELVARPLVEALR
ncbi:MAG: putative peptidoglycan D,D-transpeptidase PenA [Calditrichaeota bacterium]|nr:putative peptidoglycan D,D-transpeptidase PenA [Calditrichota bacterium]